MKKLIISFLVLVLISTSGVAQDFSFEDLLNWSNGIKPGSSSSSSSSSEEGVITCRGVSYKQDDKTNIYHQIDGKWSKIGHSATSITCENERLIANMPNGSQLVYAVGANKWVAPDKYNHEEFYVTCRGVEYKEDRARNIFHKVNGRWASIGHSSISITCNNNKLIANMPNGTKLVYESSKWVAYNDY